MVLRSSHLSWVVRRVLLLVLGGGALSPLSFSVVRGHNSSTLDVCSLSIMTRDFHAKHISWPKHGLVLLLAEKKASFRVVLYATFQNPATLCPAWCSPIVLETSFNLCTFQTTSPGFTDTMPDMALPTPPPSMVVPGFLLDLRFKNDVRRPHRKTILHPGGTLGCLSQSGTQDEALRPIVIVCLQPKLWKRRRLG